MSGDDSKDDGERTRIGGLPPAAPKPPQAPAPPPAADEPAERTVIAPARPPGVPPGAAAPTPGAGAPAAPSAPEGDDRTRVLGGAPPLPAAPASGAPPAAAPEGGDRTQVVAAPPPGTARAAVPPPAAAPATPGAPAPAAPPPAPVGDVTVDPARSRPAAAGDEERTVVLQPRKVESTMRLERTAPRGTAETIQLDRPTLLLGRGHGCDVKLRTPTASREHAKVFFKSGQWMVAGVEGKTFYADGARQAGAEIALRGGMRLRFGDDEFEVVDTAGGDPSRGGGGLWARLTAFVRGLFGRRT